MHYDSVLTLNVQLQGEKVWRLAPNHHVENPIASSDNKADHAPRFAKRPFPRRMPRGAMTFRARPGSVVFIPRGYWHETDTFGESLALTFVLGLPTWGGRLLHQLRRKLEIHAAWRGYPMASAGDPEDRAALAAQLDALLPQLREIVGALDTEAILGAPLSDRCYRWPAGQQVAVVTRAKHHLLRATGHGRVREAAIEAPFVPVVAWLCAQRAVWSLEQARAACPSVPARYVDAMLAELAAQRFVVEA
jgi:50S ribosomal protein L16 3-hydroxylase